MKFLEVYFILSKIFCGFVNKMDGMDVHFQKT